MFTHRRSHEVSCWNIVWMYIVKVIRFVVKMSWYWLRVAMLLLLLLSPRRFFPIWDIQQHRKAIVLPLVGMNEMFVTFFPSFVPILQLIMIHRFRKWDVLIHLGVIISYVFENDDMYVSFCWTRSLSCIHTYSCVWNKKLCKLIQLFVNNTRIIVLCHV